MGASITAVTNSGRCWFPMVRNECFSTFWIAREKRAQDKSLLSLVTAVSRVPPVRNEKLLVVVGGEMCCLWWSLLRVGLATTARPRGHTCVAGVYQTRYGCTAACWQGDRPIIVTMMMPGVVMRWR